MNVLNCRRRVAAMLCAGAVLLAATAGAANAHVQERLMDPAKLEPRLMVETLRPAPPRPGGGPVQAVAIPVQFEFDQWRLTAASMSSLQVVAAAMNDPSLVAATFIVEGHTDSKGTDTYNLRLSQQRAHSVAAYLVQLGVSPARLSPRGFGERRQLPGIRGEDGRNRRATFLREY